MTTVNTLLEIIPSPRILLVEDSPVQARVLTAFIRQMGCRPLGPVATAVEALALCHATWPDLAILDVHLAGTTDGLALAAELTKLGDLPLVFVSATTDPGVVERIQELQPLAFLAKPYAPESLQQVVTQGLALGYATGFSASLTTVLPKAGLFVRENSSLVRLVVADITCVQAMQQYAMLVLASGRRYSVRLTLAEVLAYLPVNFVQCHRGWVVNLQHIAEICLGANLIVLSDGTQATLGRAYRQRLQQRLRIMG